jgi:carbon monoxide dehydrogenase subunit G
MIETEQNIVINAPIEGVWDFAQDIRRWANLMPGMRECEVIDADNSRWILKVGVGGLVRTVTVDVHVDLWSGPDHVTFTYKLQGDPVQGGGTYDATRKGPNETEVALKVRVEGNGPMAPMWEAMGRPLLPQLAKGFAGQLKAEIERTVSAAPAQSAPEVVESPSLLARIGHWLRNLWQAIFRPATR